MFGYDFDFFNTTNVLLNKKYRTKILERGKCIITYSNTSSKTRASIPPEIANVATTVGIAIT